MLDLIVVRYLLFLCCWWPSEAQASDIFAEISWSLNWFNMETLKGSDKFRQLLKKFNQPNPSAKVGTSHDTSIRKSSRTIKKPEKFDSSPFVAKTKESKSRYESVSHKNKSELRVISEEGRGGNNKSKERTAGIDLDDPLSGSSRRKQVDSRKISEEQTGRYGKGNDKFRGQGADENPQAGGSGSSGGKRQDLREEITSREPSSPPQRSAFRLLAPENNRMPSTSRLMQHELASQPARRNQDHESSYMAEHRRKRDLESSYMPETRRPQDYEQSYVAGKRMVDMYSESRDDFAKPRPISSNQSRWRSNASQLHNNYGNIRQPVVRLVDVGEDRGHSTLYRSRLEIPSEPRKPSLVDVMKTRERETWQHSKMAPPPLDPTRLEGGFLRPPTPPGIAELVVKEQTLFIDTLNKFKNFTHCSTIEIIFILNHLESSLINKMSKTVKKTHSAQSELRTTVMESVPDESLKSFMVQSWLKSTNSVAPRWHDETENRKRGLGTAGNSRAKKMRMADDD
ncbi:hypothetical protein GE061_015936 [Apolygus lucorum]|uniref:Uncharacterized protein n=1 Tax=Apolygus lucorum TaxID=248454 RepID=A0A6A4K6H5_APOLU|nr:hypothetical protein GE061_015936 [Apolygus lucorum]